MTRTPAETTLHQKIGEHDAQIEALNESVGEVRKAVQLLDSKIDTGFRGIQAAVDAMGAREGSATQFRTSQLGVWAGLILTAVFSVFTIVMNAKDSHYESERAHTSERIGNLKTEIGKEIERLDDVLQREMKLNDDKISNHVDDAMALYVAKHETSLREIDRLRSSIDAMAAEDRAELRELKHRRIFSEDKQP